jgi:hypothetical protein
MPLQSRFKKTAASAPAVPAVVSVSPISKNDPLLTSEQVCVDLDISSKTLSRLRAKKAIGFITINPGNYRYRKFAHVEAFLNRRETKTRAA